MTAKLIESSSRSCATRCGGIESVQSISPACSAESAVDGSEMNRKVTPETLGGPPQYDGLALSVMESPLFWPTKENGPVPIGCVVIWPLSTLRRCTIAMPLKPPMFVSRFGVGCLSRMTTVVGVGRADVGDGTELVAVRQLLVDDAAIRVHDVVGGERAPVVEGDARSQVKVPAELIGADGPRLGERRPHLEVGVGLDQSVEDVLEHLEREVGAGLVGVELVGFTGDRGDEIAG